MFTWANNIFRAVAAPIGGLQPFKDRGGHVGHVG